MSEQAPGELRYTAFLSYSHKDAGAARRLHRRLEAYRMPKRLVGAETARGPVPERLAPIFRDREELPAATDLSETVREALARSGALIILCSPHAAASLWVAEEIRVFRALHPDRPILAAVLEGDPPDCFPAALRAFGEDGTWHEPLATDLRPHRDGQRLGLLKLVAGITGVGLDALVQRDAARRVRRVMAVTIGAVIAMLTMAALTLAAVNARAEAERQRAEAERQRAAAEGQIEFMLTDLRNRLRGVGSLEVMEAVNARALLYYAGEQRLETLPPDSLLRRARILHAIGEDHVQGGHLDRAIPNFREAYRMTAFQLARTPHEPQSLLAHGRSEYWLGRVAELRQDWPTARRRYLRFALLARRLIAVAPGDPVHMKEVAWSAVDLGNVALNGARDPAAAQLWYERAVRWFERAVAARPNDPNGARVLANAYGWLADTYYVRSLWRQSLNARRKQLRIVEQLQRGDPANFDAAYRLALAQRGVAGTLTRLGERGAARQPIFSAWDWSGRLTRRDPRNAEWLLFRSMVGCNLYFDNVGFPDGITRAGVRREVDAAAASLAAQGNPSVRSLCNCLNAMGVGPAAQCRSRNESTREHRGP